VAIAVQRPASARGPAIGTAGVQAEDCSRHGARGRAIHLPPPAMTVRRPL
jgi:hypothetical protein